MENDKLKLQDDSKMNKKEFLEHPNMVMLKANIRFSVLAYYALAIINLLSGIFYILNNGFRFSIIVSVALLITTGLLVQITYSYVAPAAMVVVEIMSIFFFHVMDGWLIILVVLYSLYYTIQFQKAWNIYLTEKIVTDQFIIKKQNKSKH